MQYTSHQAEIVRKFFERYWYELVRRVQGAVISHGKRSSFDIGHFLYLSVEFVQNSHCPKNIAELLSDRYSNEAVLIEYFKKMCDAIGRKATPTPGENEDEPPGVPLNSEDHVNAVSRMFGIRESTARIALNICKPDYGPVVSPSGIVLYHATIDPHDSTVGVANRTGRGTVVTFFYMKKNGAYYLIGMGYHIAEVDGESTYKIDKTIPRWSMLENKSVTYAKRR